MDHGKILLQQSTLEGSAKATATFLLPLLRLTPMSSSPFLLLQFQLLSRCLRRSKPVEAPPDHVLQPQRRILTTHCSRLLHHLLLLLERLLVLHLSASLLQPATG